MVEYRFWNPKNQQKFSIKKCFILRCGYDHFIEEIGRGMGNLWECGIRHSAAEIGNVWERGCNHNPLKTSEIIRNQMRTSKDLSILDDASIQELDLRILTLHGLSSYPPIRLTLWSYVIVQGSAWNPLEAGSPWRCPWRASMGDMGSAQHLTCWDPTWEVGASSGYKHNV